MNASVIFFFKHLIWLGLVRSMRVQCDHPMCARTSCIGKSNGIWCTAHKVAMWSSDVHRWRCMCADSRKDFISKRAFDYLIGQKAPQTVYICMYKYIQTVWRCFHIPFYNQRKTYFIRLQRINMRHYVIENHTFYLKNAIFFFKTTPP